MKMTVAVCFAVDCWTTLVSFLIADAIVAMGLSGVKEERNGREEGESTKVGPGSLCAIGWTAFWAANHTHLRPMVVAPTPSRRAFPAADDSLACSEYLTIQGGTHQLTAQSRVRPRATVISAAPLSLWSQRAKICVR